MRKKVNKAPKKNFSQPITLQLSTVIIIVGPTAVGKTAFAVALARHLRTEIISADSRQCYRELNIGVAKPSDNELEAVHHYFINSHSIKEEVNAAVFEELALRYADNIFKANIPANLPGQPPSPADAPSLPPGQPPSSPVAVMVGGTGLYIKAFAEGLDDIPGVDPGIRLHIQQHYEEQGLAWLQNELTKYDPEYAAKGEMSNPQRLMRALEVRLFTGQSILTFRKSEPRQRPFRIITIGLELPKEELHARIHTRVDQMMRDGLLAEVRDLLPYRSHNALQTVGYRELFEHLDGRLTLDEAITAIKTNTRRYAKRQLTWFRRDRSTVWMTPDTLIPKVLSLL
jgi:tRNA dimethylallyltransferase